MLPVSLENPRVMAWLIAGRSIGEVSGEAHAPVLPGRVRIPLVGEDQPVGGHEGVGLEGEPGVRRSSSAELAVIA